MQLDLWPGIGMLSAGIYWFLSKIKIKDMVTKDKGLMQTPMLILCVDILKIVESINYINETGVTWRTCYRMGT